MFLETFYCAFKCLPEGSRRGGGGGAGQSSHRRASAWLVGECYTYASLPHTFPGYPWGHPCPLWEEGGLGPGGSLSEHAVFSQDE